MRLVFAVCASVLAATNLLKAQDHTIAFSTTDPGVSRAITNWGLDTCWASFDNMQRGLIYMGTNNVTIVRVGFTVDAPLTNNDITPADKSTLQTCANLASMATSATMWDMNWDSTVDPWYQSGANTVHPDRWAAAIEACQRYYNRNFWMVEGFNEPDYTPNGEGSPQNLNSIFGYLQASTNFPGAYMAAGSTLNDDQAVTWFNPSAGRAAIGTTHCLAGTAANYVNFIQTVAASNAVPFNPELHNVMEAIMGVNYGLKGGIWWGPAERARGEFVKACKGSRLGYAEDLAKWTAAAVYRGTNGAIQAFLGGSERMATTTSYRFFSKDRDVFYDGYGPQRDYTVTIPGGSGYQTADQHSAEKVVNVAWGADVQPAINGRYIVVNRNSGKVLEVPGGSTGNGVVLDQNTYTGAAYQQWDVNPIPSTWGGDYSYFSIKAAHDGLNMDDLNFSYASGNQIGQWNDGTNVVGQWYLQYAGNGYFKIRSRWSNKVLGVNNASTSGGAPIVQWDDTGTADHEWRLIPATVSSYDFVAPAAPTSVSVTANAVSVQLSWKTNSELDLASYIVLRSATNGGAYDIVARGLTNNSFTDKSANLSQNYYYIVKAVDKSLNTSAASAQVSAMPTLAPTLVARYMFDGSGTDSSGNANDATLVNSPGYTTGKFGQALSLNGTNQYAMAPAGVLASATNFTISAWIYWNGGNAWQRIFDFGNDTTQYMFLTPNSGSGTFRFAVTTNGSAGEQIVETTRLASNQWVHVAVAFNGSTASIYTNGILAASGAVTIPPSAFNPVLNNFGASQFSGDPFFNGLMDDVRLYNYALDASQITQLLSTVSVWDGGGTDDNWSDGVNWNNNVAPATSGNDIIFAGSARTTPKMDTAYNVYSLTFSNTAGNFAVGTANASIMTLAGGVTNNSSSAQTLNVPVSLGVPASWNAAAGNLVVNSNLTLGTSALALIGTNDFTFNGNITGAGTFTKAGSGTLTLGGNNVSVGTATFNSGTTLISGNVTSAGGKTYIGYLTNNAVVNMSGGSFNIGDELRVGGSDQNGSTINGTGFFTMSGGTANLTALTVARGNYLDNSVSGTVSLSAGSTLVSTNDVILEYAGSGLGRLVINGGNFVIGPAATKWFMIGYYDAGAGEVDITNGNLSLDNGSSIKMCRAGNTGGNVVNQSGGAVTFYSDSGVTAGGGGNLDLNYSGGASSSSTYNLNGGTLTVPQIIASSLIGTGTFNFNGGTLKPTATSTTFMQGLTAANVRNSGAIIDTAGFNVTIAQALRHSAIGGDNAFDGGLTKLGSGTLTLSGINTYNGPTIVSNDVLALGSVASIANSTNITVAVGAQLDVSAVAGGFTLGTGQTLSGSGAVNGTLANGGIISPGVAGTIGTLTFSNSPALNSGGAIFVKIDRNNGAFLNDQVRVPAAAITYGGALTVTNAGAALQGGDSFQLFSATGYAGSFAATNLPALSTGLVWSNSVAVNGRIAVVSTVSRVPTNVVWSVNGNNLTLSWPADHTGWRLQVQTNTLSVGIGTNWTDVPGTTVTNSFTSPVDPTKGSIFYRLAY